MRNFEEHKDLYTIGNFYKNAINLYDKESLLAGSLLDSKQILPK